MRQLWYAVQVAIATMGSFTAWFMGGIDGYIHVLVAFMSVDYVTGVLTSVIKHKLSSQIGSKGILQKVMIFMIIGLSNLVDKYLLLDSGMLRMVVIFFYISNEGVSILENADAMGLPIPAKLKKVLSQFKEDK